MSIALLIVMGLLGLAALGAWILAIRISYRIERLRQPDLPKIRLAYTNIFATAFWSGPGGEQEQALQPKLRRRLLFALACLLAMGALSFVLPLLSQTQKPLPTSAIPADSPHAAPPTKITDRQPLTGENPIGTALFYTRSNQDGTKPETVIVHIVSPTELHVAKMVAPCTDAAYVTAVIDPATHEPTQLVGGRLQRDGSQLPQAWLRVDQSTRKLTVRFGKPDAPIAETHTAPPAPWRMYDFDLAEFALAGPPAKDNFTFGMAMAWPGADPPSIKILGEARADLLVASSSRSNHYALYTVTGEPFGPDGGGVLKLDPVGGHVINARLDRPNHPGYDDFMLQLDAVHRADGDLAWNDAIAKHWKNCPA